MTDEPLPDSLLAAYLARLDLTEAPAPSRAALDDLVVRHLHRVPFENLEIWHRREISLDTRSLVEKVALRRRGGFCFEVNEAFRALLARLGFVVHRIEGQVYKEPTANYGFAFDHLALVVEIDGEPLLVDVGFGDGPRRPMPLPAGRHRDISGDYALDGDGEAGTLRRVGGGTVRPLYRFTRARRQLPDYAEMCRYHQTSPQSIFTQGLICTLATPTGRISLTQDRLITNKSGQRHEELVTDEVTRASLLAGRFGIVI